jgi:predicted transcriptional regulator YdeE
LENVMVSGIRGSKTEHAGIRGVGYKVLAPYSGLAAKSREARRDLLNQLEASTGNRQSPLMYTISPPEKITTMDDVHTLYIMVDRESFGDAAIPDELVSLEVPTQQCIHFHYQGPMKNSTPFYFELFEQIGNGEIPYDNKGYRIEEYGDKHNWDDMETPDNELDIFFPVK